MYRMQALDEDDRDEWLRELSMVRGISRFDLGGVPETDVEADMRGRTGSEPIRNHHHRSVSADGFDRDLGENGATSSGHRITLSSSSKGLDLKLPKSPKASPSTGCEQGHRFQDGGAVIFCTMCGEQRNKIVAPENRVGLLESTHFSRLAELGTFTFTSKEAVGFDIPPGVPSTAHEVLICYFLLCGLEYEQDGPSRIFRVRLWTTGGHVMWKLGARYPQTTLSFDSDNIWFPLGSSDRRLYVQCDDVQSIPCRAIELFVAGYR